MTCTELRSLEDCRRYVHALATRRVEDDPVCRALWSAKRISYEVLLAGAFLFYYLLDKMSEALSLL